ncbi:MAG: hypothetical protein AAF944_17960 [Bacteroidota bacterium]
MIIDIDKLQPLVINHHSSVIKCLVMQHMTLQKKIFLVVAVLFLLIMLYLSYDIAQRTTFPGSKPNLQERIAPSADTLNQD